MSRSYRQEVSPPSKKHPPKIRKKIFNKKLRQRTRQQLQSLIDEKPDEVVFLEDELYDQGLLE